MTCCNSRSVRARIALTCVVVSGKRGFLCVGERREGYTAVRPANERHVNAQTDADQTVAVLELGATRWPGPRRSLKRTA
jgi:hypothetical protein